MIDVGWIEFLTSSFARLSISGGEDDDRGRAVASSSVLHLAQLHEDARGRVLDLELREDGRAVVGDRHLAEVVDEHLVEANRAQRRLDDVGDGERGGHILRAHSAPETRSPWEGERERERERERESVSTHF